MICCLFYDEDVVDLIYICRDEWTLFSLVEMFVVRVRRMRAKAKAGPCVFVGDARCVILRERTGVSDACDAESLVCSHERRGREMLGFQFGWPGDGLCFFVLLVI